MCDVIFTSFIICISLTFTFFYSSSLDNAYIFIIIIFYFFSFLENGGSILLQDNVDVYISDIEIYNSRATGNGGGITIRRFYKNIQLFNIHMDSCRADFNGKGGGLSIENDNNDIIISNITIINSRAFVGAGIYINNHNFNVIVNKRL